MSRKIPQGYKTCSFCPDEAFFYIEPNTKFILRYELGTGMSFRVGRPEETYLCDFHWRNCAGHAYPLESYFIKQAEFDLQK